MCRTITHKDTNWFIIMSGLQLLRAKANGAPFLWPRASSSASASRLTFVTGDGCQLLSGTPVLLTAGLARRLGGCQRHRGRVGHVAWLQEEEGMVTAVILWRSWGTVPIRDLKYLMRKEKRLNPGPSQPVTLQRHPRRLPAPSLLASRIKDCHSQVICSLTYLQSRTNSLFLPEHFVLSLRLVSPMYSDAHLCDVISDPLCTSLLDTKLIDTQGDIRGARYQNSTHAISHCRTNVQTVIIQTLNT